MTALCHPDRGTTRRGLSRLGTCLFSLLAVCLSGTAAQAEGETWAELKPDLFGERVIQDGADWLSLEAPYRAHDAAIVPIDIVALRPQTEAEFIKKITLVIDENPAPVAAVFHLAPQSGIASLSTRVRVNEYTSIRAIAETSDGALYMTSRFVKAAGGCAAPATKDQDDAFASMGKMKFRHFLADLTGDAPAPAAQQEVQFMIRHPNNSGLQRDQVTLHYIPAHFVRDIEVRQGDDVLLSIEGAISLSEDPTVRFSFQSNGADQITVRAIDTEDQVFTNDWKLRAAETPES